MANLSTMFPAVDINQLGPVGGMMIGDMFNMAKQNNQINQQTTQAEEQRAAAMHPLEMGFKQAQTGYQNALSRNTNAQADKSIWDLEQDKRLAEPKYQAELSNLLATTSANEVKQAHAKLEQQLMSPDPKVRQQAQAMYKATGDMLKMYEQENEKRKTATQVAGIHAQATKEAAAARSSGSKRIPRTNQEALQYYLAMAANPETSEEDKADALEMANQIKQTMLELANARGPMYTIPGGGNLQVNPNGPGKNTPLVAPGVNLPSATPARKAEHTMDQLRAAYKGRSDAEIKAAYKAKFGIEPQ